MRAFTCLFLEAICQINLCTILVRPRGGERAEALGPALSRAVAELDPDLPIYFPGTPAQFHHEILNGNRVIATLFTIFGVIAFILSAVGLYGVMSFSVNQRTQEFGIRMALGADAARIFRMVMTQGAWQLAIGLVLGAGGIALLLGVVAASALKNSVVQGERARSDHLFRGGRTAYPRRGNLLFCPRSAGNARRSDGCAPL